jgi:hypothetical protein
LLIQLKVTSPANDILVFRWRINLHYLPK